MLIRWGSNADILVKASKETGVEVNTDKTKYMKIGGKH
jgi:hypothetical protein